MKKFIRTAVDLGKNYFQFHGLASEGSVPVSRKLKRSKVLEFYAQIEPCRVGTEFGGPEQPFGVMRKRHRPDGGVDGRQREQAQTGTP